jgi:hypothetical protein
MLSVKKFSSVLVIISLSFITVVAQHHSAGQTTAESASWFNIAPERSGFILLMPGRAAEEVNPVASSPGVENHTFTFETPEAGYVFSYVQFGQDITDPNAIKGMLDAGREGGIASSGGKLKNEKDIRLGEHYGREWLLEMPGGFAAIDRAYWVKRRLYQLVFIVTPKATDTPETIRLRQDLANRFFDSFRLVSEVGQ